MQKNDYRDVYLKNIKEIINIKGYYFLEDRELKFGNIINKKIKAYNKKFNTEIPIIGSSKKNTVILKEKLCALKKEKRLTDIENLLSYIEIRDTIISSKIKLTDFVSIRNKILELISDKTIIFYDNTQIFYKPEEVELYIISCLNDFNNLISKLPRGLYYRGQQSINWKNEPSIFRKKNWINNEKNMIEEMERHFSEQFKDCEKTLEKLTKLQHYQLPTRLLDITSNASVALYFACEQSTEKNNSNNAWGEITIYLNENSMTHYEDLATSVISNLSLMDTKFNLSELKQKIKKEGFEPSDEEIQNFKAKTIIVLPKENNIRIKNQSGLFILFGMGKEKNTSSCISDLYFKKSNKQIVFIIKDKIKLLEELDTLTGINKGFIYPDFDSYAIYLKNEKFKGDADV